MIQSVLYSFLRYILDQKICSVCLLDLFLMTSFVTGNLYPKFQKLTLGKFTLLLIFNLKNSRQLYLEVIQLFKLRSNIMSIFIKVYQ